MEVLDRIVRRARQFPEQAAFVEAVHETAGGGGQGRTITYRELAAVIEAARARGQAGGVAVATAGNRIEAVAQMLSAWAGGGQVLGVPAGATAFEVQRLVERVQEDRVHESGACLLLSSSGTVGRPKVVRRTAASLDAVARNVADANFGGVGMREGDRVLGVVPLGHSYGVEHCLLGPMWAGATVVLCPGMSMAAVGWAFTSGIDVVPSIPAMIEMFAGTHLPGVERPRVVYSAGGVLPTSVEGSFHARYGLHVGQLYGTTEVGSVVYRPGGEGVGVGRAMADVDILIADDAEVGIKSASMMSGYVGDDRATMCGPYFMTGDLGKMDGPFLMLHGRKGLLIDSGGIKVNPAEVEEILCQHPGVRECVVMALRQTETVNRLRAVVVPQGKVSAEEIRAFVREKLAGHKVPRVVDFVESLPRSATGKILRHRLEAQ